MQKLSNQSAESMSAIVAKNLGTRDRRPRLKWLASRSSAQNSSLINCSYASGSPLSTHLARPFRIMLPRFLFDTSPALKTGDSFLLQPGMLVAQSDSPSTGVYVSRCPLATDAAFTANIRPSRSWMCPHSSAASPNCRQRLNCCRASLSSTTRIQSTSYSNWCNLPKPSKRLRDCLTHSPA